MNIRHTLLLLPAVLATLAACTQTEEWDRADSGTGIRVSLTDQPAPAETRATPQELRELAGDDFLKDFKIRVTDPADPATATTYDYPGDGQTIPLKPGTYQVGAYYGDNPVLALDAPYYEGAAAETVDVAEGQAPAVSIACSVANALVSVKYENEVKIQEAYTRYGLTAEIGETSVTTTDPAQSIYFRAGTAPALYFTAQRTGSGEAVKLPLTEGLPDAYKAGDHLILTLKMTPEMKLEITTKVNTVTVQETLPQEWLPKPKVEAEGFAGNALTFTETELPTASIRLTTSSAIQDLKLALAFEDPQFSALNGSYRFSKAEDNAKLAEIEETLGIDLPGIGEEGKAVDLSPLLAKLQAKADGANTNTVSIDVLANGRWSSTGNATEGDPTTYTLTCNRPQFSVSVQPENVWSKQFTIDEATVTTGNAEALKEKLVYQYKATDSDTWTDCTNGLTQTFDSHPDNKSYQVRALYRGVIASEATEITLETPAQLPNSGMEEWSWAQTHEDAWYNPIDADTYTVYPWNNGDSAPYWNTNNDFTTRNRGTFANPYNSFPAVSFVKGAHSEEWAVELRNTGNGRGNTLPSNVLDMNKVAGELFLGDINVTTGGTDALPSGDNYTIVKGRNWNVRPTAVKFWYKYAPLNTDTWRVNIQLLDADNNVIIEKVVDSSTSQAEWKEETVTLDYQEGQSYAKCAKIYLYFASTINTGENLQYEKSSYSIWLDSETSFDDVWHGSVLTIDDISLVYDK